MEHAGSEKKKLVIPLVVLIVVSCLVALIIYPVVSASPKDISLAVLSLDEGAQAPQGEVNAGEMAVAHITSAAEDDSPVAWTEFDSQKDLDDAFAANEIYAAIVLPADFTSSSMAAQMGLGEQSVPKVIIDQGKNPAIAETIETMLAQMLSEQNMNVEIEYVNQVDEGLGSGIMAQQMSYLLTILITIVCSIVLFVASRPAPHASKKDRVVGILIQLSYAALLSLGIGWFVSFFMTAFAELAIPFVEIMLFIWLASFALMMLFLCFFNLHFALGALALVTIVVCGITTALIPFELLPEFWQSWLYPWIPERFVADGLAQILYRGAEVWNSSSMMLAGIAAGGAALSFLSLLKPSSESKAAKE
ncbi:MAG: YhgE/Pip domain-containing protein [Raoultibacter sp.]|jgi:hypothetical protein